MKNRIFLTGTGGQGTLTATHLLTHSVLQQGLDVTSGEIHGMAQRGGVVESTVLIGGWKSPKISPGEADVLLAFEPMEALRALPYLAKGGVVFCSTDPVPPVSVAMGRESYPDMDVVTSRLEACAGKVYYLPCRQLGTEAGAAQAGNLAIFGAMCAVGVVPLTVDGLKEGVRSFLPPKLVDVNLKAVDLGVAAVA